MNERNYLYVVSMEGAERMRPIAIFKTKEQAEKYCVNLWCDDVAYKINKAEMREEAKP